MGRRGPRAPPFAGEAYSSKLLISIQAGRTRRIRRALAVPASVLLQCWRMKSPGSRVATSSPTVQLSTMSRSSLPPSSLITISPAARSMWVIIETDWWIASGTGATSGTSPPRAEGTRAAMSPN